MQQNDRFSIYKTGFNASCQASKHTYAHKLFGFM